VGVEIGGGDFPFRVGVFQRLRCNAWVLVHFLLGELPEAELLELSPTAMRLELAAGRVDLALLPSAELLRLPDCKIVSDCCIACAGEVRSVRLISKKPIEKICTLALDESSRSSVLMCEILLLHYFGLRPARNYFNANINTDFGEVNLADNCGADAFVIIGNKALSYNPPPDWIYQYDLGKLWFEKTGLPFVFATWASCNKAVWANDKYIHACQQARNHATNNIEKLLNEKYNEYPNFDLKRNLVKSYLTKSITYNLTNNERAGLQLFFDLALKYGFAESKMIIS
jgi:chorismate dehydratase